MSATFDTSRAFASRTGGREAVRVVSGFLPLLCLLPLDLSSNRLAQAIGVPANRISEIVAEERAVTADTALRLAAALGTTPEFWLNLQQSYELRLAEQDKETVK